MQNFKGKADGRIILPVVLLIVTTVYLIEALRTAPPIEDGIVSVSFFPIIITIVMYIASFVVLRNGLIERKSVASGQFTLIKPLKVVILTGIYIGLFKPIGYIFSTILYVFSLMLVFEATKKSNLKRLIIAIIITILVFLLFEKIFRVRVPKLGGLI